MVLRYYLVIDRNCNMDCVYCALGDIKEKSCKPYIEKKDPKEIATYFPENGEYEIEFYGGEPFLFFDYMLELCDAIKSRNPKVVFKCPTNGSLLTIERARKINEYGIQLSVSHDGYAYKSTRRAPDFLAKNPDPFLELNDKHAIATISALNWDYFNIIDYFEQFRVLHGLEEKVRVSFCHLKDVDGYTNESLFLYDHPGFELMLDRFYESLFNRIVSEDWDSYEWLAYRKFLGYMNYKERRLQNGLGHVSQCGSEDAMVTFDVAGNYYGCHNSYTVIGQVGKDERIFENHWKNTPTCQTCPVYTYCGGGCLASSAEKRKYFCYVYKNEYLRCMDMLRKIKEMVY